MSDPIKQIEKLNKESSLITKLVTNLKKQFAEAGKILSGWLSLGSATSRILSKTQNALSELKEMDSLLTKISRTNQSLSKSDLAHIADRSFDIANKYGKNASDVLTKIQEASQAGFKDAQGIAELWTAAQSVGDMTEELADKIILATDRAYRMNGSVSELTKTLDGMYSIASRNALHLSDLSLAMSSASSTAASLGVDADEAAAALGTMLSAAGQSAADAADAFKSILYHTRQISDASQGTSPESLAAYEAACSALNVRLKETRDGILSLRDPMEVLKELSAAYNRLEETDLRKTTLLDSLGGDLSTSQFDALLRQWDTYETMLGQYADGTGSLAAEAAKHADSWEGSLNRLSNTWTDTIGNVADSDAVISAIDGLNSLLSAVNQVTDVLGSWGTIGLGAGLFTGLKNVGSPKMSGLSFVEEYTDSMSVLPDTAV